MARTVVELFDEAADLGEDERATLAGLLLESLETEPEADIECVWTSEIRRRIKEIDAGEAKLVPWEDVKARLLTD